MLLIVYLAGIAAPLNQFKVPPVMRQLMESFDISLAASGWLMSIFALVGFIFALPSGFIVRRIGLKASGITALSTLLLGSAAGSLSESAQMILISRTIEGAGLCLVAITGPAAIAAWFAPEKRGIPMGIWATWVPVGTILMFSLAPLFEKWHHLWVLSSAYTVLILILFCLFFKVPENSGKIIYSARKTNPYANLNIWMLGLVFMIFNITTISLKSYVPMFVTQQHNFSGLKALALTNLIMIFSTITGPVTGLLSDIIKSRRFFLVTGTLIAAVVMAFFFTPAAPYLSLFMILAGISGGMVPVAVFSMAPDIMKDPAQAGTGMSVVAFGQNAGMFAGPVLFSSVSAYFSWQAAGGLIALMLIFASAVSFFIKVK